MCWIEAVVTEAEVTATGLSLGGMGMDWRSHVNVRLQMSLRVDIQDLGENSGVTSMEDRVARLRESDDRLWTHVWATPAHTAGNTGN